MICDWPDDSGPVRMVEVQFWQGDDSARVGTDPRIPGGKGRVDVPSHGDLCM